MNLEILGCEASSLGLLVLRRRALLSQPGTTVTEITLDHEFLMSSYHTASEQALAKVALGHHEGSELKVLVGGLGLGYTAFEVLQSQRVNSVEVVEFLPQVVTWMEQGLFPLSKQLTQDKRLAVTEGDAYERLLGQPDQSYDLILIDVDHSPDERLDNNDLAPNQRFYTETGLARVKQHLAKGGILGVWSYAQSSPFAEALKNGFKEVWVEPVTFDNILIDEQTTDWLFFARD